MSVETPGYTSLYNPEEMLRTLPTTAAVAEARQHLTAYPAHDVSSVHERTAMQRIAQQLAYRSIDATVESADVSETTPDALTESHRADVSQQTVALLGRGACEVEATFQELLGAQSHVEYYVVPAEATHTTPEVDQPEANQFDTVSELAVFQQQHAAELLQAGTVGRRSQESYALTA